jgi:hypothetical protein
MLEGLDIGEIRASGREDGGGFLVRTRENGITVGAE